MTTLTKTDPRALFARSVAHTGGVIAAVRPEQLDGSTPCDEMNVRQLLAHVVTVLGRVAALGRGEDPFSVQPVEAGDDGWADAWTAAAHHVQAAWTDDAVVERTMTLPWLSAPGGVVLRSYLGELIVHAWDLAVAIGQRPEWDDELLAVALDSYRAVLPDGDRCAAFEAARQQMPPELRDFPPPFGEVVPTPAGAPLIDQLVAWTGRTPRP